MKHSRKKSHPPTNSNKLLLRAKERTKRLKLTFELSAANCEIVTFSLDLLEFRLEATQLVDTFLSIPAGSQSVGFAFLNTGRLRRKGTVLGSRKSRI